MGVDEFDACAQCVRAALNVNTARALRADLAIYTAWCTKQGVSAVPASAETVAKFVDAMGETRAPATVRRYLTSIAVAHRTVGLESTTKSEAVRRALKQMNKVKSQRQEQAHGLTWGLRECLLGATGDELIDARNRALLAVAYDGLLRRGELVALQVPDIVEEIDGSATVLVRGSKTDPEGWGEQVYVARDSMQLVREWLERSGVRKDKVFRALSRHGRVGEILDDGEVPRIFKRMAETAGLAPEVVERISGHSTRVGATQDMVASGIGMPAILQAGRWKTSVMVTRYAERLLARRNGAAQLARLQGRE